jgi:hypothetical protein
MEGVVRLTRSRSAKRAWERIKRLWDQGVVEYALHATKRLEERGLDANDIQNVIRYGTVTHSGPSDFPDTPTRFVLEGAAVEGVPADHEGR